MTEHAQDKNGAIAYAAYGDIVDYKNYQGLPMPTWNELPEKIRAAWRAAAQAVLDECFPVR